MKKTTKRAKIKQIETGGKLLRLAYVMADGLDLNWVPWQDRDSELCSAAVQQNPMAIKYVPPKLLTEKTWLDAISRNPEATRYLMAEQLTETICQAIKAKCAASQYIIERPCKKSFCIRENHYVEAEQMA